MRVLSIGEIIFDIYGDSAVIGGAPLNFCAHCALLGAESALISAVGNDGYSEKAIEKLKKFGVDNSFVKRSVLPTGKCIVTMDENAVPCYDVIRPAAYDDIILNEEDIKEIRKFSADVFAFGTLIQRENNSENALRKILSECTFGEIFCDVNLRSGCYNEASCRLCLENATILKLSDEEEPMLASFGLYERKSTVEETVKAISEKFPNLKLILFTMGENGSMVYEKKNDKFYCFDAVRVNAVSTVGAGDSYSAAFLCEYLKSGDVEKSGNAGTKLSAEVVSVKEAVPI